MAMRLFLIYALVELAVVVALVSTIGFGWTVLAAARHLRARPRAGRFAGQAPDSPAAVRVCATPQGAVTDSALVALGTVLVVRPRPGQSALGLLLLLPPTRAVARPVVTAHGRPRGCR